MRVLGSLLVAAALLFSTGGVALRIQADAQIGATPAADAQAHASPDSGVCAATASAPGHTIAVRLPPYSGSGNIVTLNTSGYNYAGPRDAPSSPSTNLPASSQDRE